MPPMQPGSRGPASSAAGSPTAFHGVAPDDCKAPREPCPTRGIAARERSGAVRDRLPGVQSLAQDGWRALRDLPAPLSGPLRGSALLVSAPAPRPACRAVRLAFPELARERAPDSRRDS